MKPLHDTTTYVSSTWDTPDGPFSIIATPQHVLASGWTDQIAELHGLIHATLRPDLGAIEHLEPGEVGGPSTGSAPFGGASEGNVSSGKSSAGDPSAGSPGALAQALAALAAYYDNDASLIGSVPVVQKSGPFREHAWEVLRSVAPGEVVTYTQYAQRAGRPSAVRAAASACALNAAALFVPCHRILRSDGTLGGFRYGLAIKESLLKRENAASVA